MTVLVCCGVPVTAPFAATANAGDQFGGFGFVKNDISVHVFEPVPDADSVVEYGCPTYALGRTAVEMSIGLTRIRTACVAVSFCASVIRTSNTYVPAAVGV